MPGLGFGKEGLDPDLPFAHRLLVRLGGVVAAHSVEISLGEGAVDDAALVTARALGFDGTGVAAGRVGAIDHLVFGVLDLAAEQALPLRAAIDVLVGIVAKRPLAKERRAGIEIRQREERANAGVLEGDDVLGRAIG